MFAYITCKREFRSQLKLTQNFFIKHHPNLSEVSTAEMSISMNSDFRQSLEIAESHFRKACEQVIVMNRQIKDLTDRFEEAESAGNKTMRYKLRLRLSVIEGVRNMFYEFAAQKAVTITQLQRLVLAYDAGDMSDAEMTDDFSAADDSLQYY